MHTDNLLDDDISLVGGLPRQHSLKHVRNKSLGTHFENCQNDALVPNTGVADSQMWDSYLINSQ